MTAHNELRRNRAEEGGVMTDEPVTLTPVDYEQCRPALQAMAEVFGETWLIEGPLEDFDKTRIRAGLAFAAAMASDAG